MSIYHLVQDFPLHLAMASIVDSEAAFAARAKKFGIAQNHIDALRAANMGSFGQYAFIVIFNSNSVDDAPLKLAVANIIGSEPTTTMMAHFRRLQFESHAIAISDAKMRIEKTDDMPIRKLPAPERAARHALQVQRLTGLVWTPTLEPSHQLLDRVQQQVEENIVAYVGLEMCTGRVQELAGVKTEQVVKVDKISGVMRVNDTELQDTVCISTDYSLRIAFRRRALAYDQSNLCQYETLELWTEKLYAAMEEPAPQGYVGTSKVQMLLADRKLFQLIADECRDGVLAITSQSGHVTRPIEVALKNVWNDPRIVFHLLPLPRLSAGRAEAIIDREMESDESGLSYAKRRRLRKGKEASKVKESGHKPKHEPNPNGKGKGKGTKSLPALKGCWTHVHGKPICHWFNIGGCRSESKPGETCKVGVHLCATPGCSEPHPHISCPKKTSKP